MPEGLKPRRDGTVRRNGGDPTRRNPQVHEAILAATWHLLGQVGYHDLTIEGVASEAEVGKATIYRWWPSKGSLVGEAIAKHLEIGPEPDTGSSWGDLRASIQSAIENYSGTIAGVVIPALAADLVHDPDLFRAFQERFLYPRREARGGSSGGPSPGAICLPTPTSPCCSMSGQAPSSTAPW